MAEIDFVVVVVEANAKKHFLTEKDKATGHGKKSTLLLSCFVSNVCQYTWTLSSVL
jgi:hypothetical protein